MENKELLNEERYQKTNKKVSLAALIVLIIGLIIGGVLIFLGITNVIRNNKEYSENSRQRKINEITVKLNEEKTKLEDRKNQLINKGVIKSIDYNNKEGYELYVLNNALDPSKSRCWSTEENYDLTSNYCELKNKLYDVKTMNLEFNKSWQNGRSIVFFSIGGFIIFMSFAISASIFRVSKNREILAYGTQQAMPVVKESAEKMAPTIGVIAKEVVKGINEAKIEQTKCPECGKIINKDAKFCDNCGKKM